MYLGNSFKSPTFVILFAVICLCNQSEVFAEKKAAPFFPSQLRTGTGEPLKHTDFESPEVCAGCHKNIHTQWKGSMHGVAFIDPIFQALWKLGEKETQGLTNNLCGGCHGAVGVMSNELTFKDGEFQAPDIAKQGVHCDLCHTITASAFADTPTYEPGNASFVSSPGSVKRGPRKDSKSPYHETAYSELHTSSLFCANCHQVFHPINNFHIERTYDEWKYSVYAQNDIQCQDCHMMPVDKAIEAAKTLKKQKNPGKSTFMGPDRDTIFSHEFVGANFTVPELLGNIEHGKIARKRLQNAAELTIEAPQQAQTGELAKISVTVTNVGAGHNLPTSLTEVRQMWLDVEVLDSNGKTIYQSGKLDKQGTIKDDPRIFNAYAQDNAGQHTYKPWEITQFKYNKTIPPKGSATENFFVLVPDTLKGELIVKVMLRYRSYPQALANLLLGDKAFELPICDMAQKETKILVKN